MAFVLRHPPESADPKDLYKYLVELWKAMNAGALGWSNIDGSSIPTFLHGDAVDNPSEDVHGADGEVIGENNIQTLRNKTILVAFVEVDADYSAMTIDNIIKATIAGVTITLPETGPDDTGKAYSIDNASGGEISVTTSMLQTIEGETTQTLPANSCMSIYSDGANWRIR